MCQGGAEIELQLARLVAVATAQGLDVGAVRPAQGLGLALGLGTDGVKDRVKAGRGRGLVRSALRQGGAVVRLAKGWFAAEEHDVVVVGSGGVIDAPLVRFLQNFDRRPIVLDAFIPLYDTAVRDRGLAPEGSPRARLLRGLERLAGRVADLVLAGKDTIPNGFRVEDNI